MLVAVVAVGVLMLLLVGIMIIIVSIIETQLLCHLTVCVNQQR